MTFTRRLARPMLASVFVTAGIDVLRNPGPRAKIAAPVAAAASSALPIPDDPELLVKVNAGVQLGAGVLLAAGRFPRLAALALAGSIIPTTAAGHRFWEEEDPSRRAQQQIHFFKNLAILGGLILAAVDTEGAPSLTWRAKQAIESTTAVTADALSRGKDILTP